MCFQKKHTLPNHIGNIIFQQKMMYYTSSKEDEDETKGKAIDEDKNEHKNDFSKWGMEQLHDTLCLFSKNIARYGMDIFF